MRVCRLVVQLRENSATAMCSHPASLVVPLTRPRKSSVKKFSASCFNYPSSSSNLNFILQRPSLSRDILL